MKTLWPLLAFWTVHLPYGLLFTFPNAPYQRSLWAAPHFMNVGGWALMILTTAAAILCCIAIGRNVWKRI